MVTLLDAIQIRKTGNIIFGRTEIHIPNVQHKGWQHVYDWHQSHNDLSGHQNIGASFEDNIGLLETINNNYFNNPQYPYIAEAEKIDNWLTPSEFVDNPPARDCEDFAVMKMRDCEGHGFSVRDMRVVVALDNTERLVHAILAVKIVAADGVLRWAILDILSNEVHTDDAYGDMYTPLYSVRFPAPCEKFSQTLYSYR